METTMRRINEQRVEDLERLARQGEAKGVRIMVDHVAGAHVATSASDASRCYVVSVEGGCSCRGYAVWRRCQHWAVLLAELGRLDVVTPVAPTPGAPAARAERRCQSSGGAGWVYAENQYGRIERVSCWMCDGVGVDVPAPAA